MGRNPNGWTCDICGCGKDKYGKLYIEDGYVLCYPCLEATNAPLSDIEKGRCKI